MGFLAGSFERSVFNLDSYGSALGRKDENGYAVVRIIPNSNRLMGVRDPSIKGVYDDSSGGLSFNIEANWSSLGDLGGLSLLPSQFGIAEKVYGSVNKYGSIGGLSNLGAALSSRLVYQKGGYLTLRVPMMIVDWDGKGQPIMSSLLLARYCLPQEIAGSEELKISAEKAKEIYNEVKEWLRKQGKKDDDDTVLKILAKGALKGLEGLEEGVEFARKQIQDVADSNPVLKESIKRATESIGSLEDAYTLRASPTPVAVEIGQYFSNNNMVIKGVEFEFSREMTEAGPLFVKVNLDLSTRTILTDLDSVGLHEAQKKSRYLSVKGQTLVEGAGSNATGFPIQQS